MNIDNSLDQITDVNGDNILRKPFVGVVLLKTSAQSIPDTDGSTFTNLTWNSEQIDSDGFWSSGAPITVPAGLGGRYFISALIHSWSDNASDAGGGVGATFAGQITINGVSVQYSGFSDSNTFKTMAQFHTLRTLTAGDVIRVTASQNAGAAKNVSSGAFFMYKVG